MRAVDTNVLVRLLVRDDLDQVKTAESFIAPGGWVSHLVLAEALWVLDAVYDRTAGGDLLQDCAAAVTNTWRAAAPTRRSESQCSGVARLPPAKM